MNLLFSIDKNCVDLLLNCIYSIEENGGADSYHAFVLHSDLTKDVQEKIQSLAPASVYCEFITVPEDLFAGFPETKRYPKQIYYRLAAANLLPVYVDRVLYMDVDTLVINPLSELYEDDFEDNIFMACTHTKKFLSFINQLRLDVGENVPYVNTGIMMMNLPLMRAEVDLDDIQQYAIENKNFLILPDQDILTALYGHRVKVVDALKYNLSDRDIDFHNADPSNEKIDLDWVRNNTVIVHYYGRNKPWKGFYIGILDVLYEEQLTRDRKRRYMNNNTKEQLEVINQQLKELVGIYRGAVSHLNISDNEFWIWYSLIMMDGEYSQQDICNMWSFSKQTVNTIIAHLVKKELITLEVVPGTRNRKIIRLTEEGRNYGESIVLPVAEAEQRAFEKLPDEDRAVFTCVIGKYIENLKGEFYETAD